MWELGYFIHFGLPITFMLPFQLINVVVSLLRIGDEE